MFVARTSPPRLMLLCTLAFLPSCTSDTSQREGAPPSPPAGHLVLGERSARFWGLTPGGQYSELARSDLPGVVAGSVDGWVAAYRYNAGCTRYFGAEALFLVTARTSCAGRDTGESFQIVAFDSAGGAVRVGISNTWDAAIRLTMGDRSVPARAP